MHATLIQNSATLIVGICCYRWHNSNVIGNLLKYTRKYIKVNAKMIAFGKENFCRTSGDGMEQVEPTLSKVEENSTYKNDIVDTNLKKVATFELHKLNHSVNQRNRKSSRTNEAGSSPLPGLHTLYRRPDNITHNIAPVIPKGQLVQLIPRLVTPLKKTPERKNTKPPRFVPYEPYPGAVNPITKPLNYKQKISKNNMDINVLAEQMSTMRTQELQLDKTIDGNRNGDKELQKLKEELKKANEERDHFQAQLKFQTQVNAELKNLLVASVGEDLQTRVNVLTEDKLQLARALLDTANNLTTHTEQIEFLAGQCEVWRSKFLASSVMVEELARWKADLTQKNEMLNESTKQLLHATHQIREIQLDMLQNLKFLAKIRYINLPATDVISLSAENLNILQQMVLHSGIGVPETNINISSTNVSPLCKAEKYAIQALGFISQPLVATDEAIRALFGQVQRPYVINNVETTAAKQENQQTDSSD